LLTSPHHHHHQYYRKNERLIVLFIYHTDLFLVIWEIMDQSPVESRILIVHILVRAKDPPMAGSDFIIVATYEK
jgi:hypothetical protein